MHEVGRELAEARRRLGFSLEDISTRTKVSVERLSAIERGVVQELPPLVYLSGFLRAYAAEVQLDGADITRRYLAELQELPPPAPSSDLEVSTPSEQNPVAEAISADHAESGFTELPSEAAGVREFAPQPLLKDAEHEVRPIEIERALETEFEPELDAEPPEQSVPEKRYELEFDSEPEAPSSRMFAAVPLGEREAPERSGYSHSNAPQRLGVLLAVVAAGVIAGVLLSANLDVVRSHLEDWWTRDARQASSESKEADRRNDAAAPAQPSGEPATPLTPNVAPGPPAPTPSQASPTTAPNTSAPEEDAKRAAADASSPAEAATRTVDPTVPQPESNTSQVADDEANDLSGSWTFTNRVESTAYEPYSNLNLGFRVQLEQRGNRITGTGQKWMENGKALAAAARTPIALEGTRDGRRLELNFTETGGRRVSSGKFVLEITDEGTLQGSFSSDVANTQGSSLARRTVPPRSKPTGTGSLRKNSTPATSQRPNSARVSSPGATAPGNAPAASTRTTVTRNADSPGASSVQKKSSQTDTRSRTSRSPSSPHTNVPRTSLLRTSSPKTTSPRPPPPRPPPPRLRP